MKIHTCILVGVMMLGLDVAGTLAATEDTKERVVPVPAVDPKKEPAEIIKPVPKSAVDEQGADKRYRGTGIECANKKGQPSDPRCGDEGSPTKDQGSQEQGVGRH